MRLALAAILASMLLVANMPSLAAPSRAQTSDSAVTGVPPVDAVINHLRTHDVDAILDDVAFIPRPCSLNPASGRPYCLGGVGPEGTPTDSFLIKACPTGTFFDIARDQVRDRLRVPFGMSAAGSVFAVVRGSLSADTADDYVVALSPGASPAPTADGTLWQVTADGKIVAADVDIPCAPAGIVQRLRHYFPAPEYVAGPVLNCSPGPGQSVHVIVQIEGVYGDVTPHFWGRASTLANEATGERAVVRVLASTRWNGAVTQFFDARVGTEVQVTGFRLRDCTIEAVNVFMPDPRFAIGGRVLQDSDADNSVSFADGPAITRVDLTPDGRAALHLISAADGSYRFTNIPPGDYHLTAYWLSGFVPVWPITGGSTPYDLALTVGPDGAVDVEVPPRLLVRKASDGVPQFELDPAEPVAYHTLDVGAAMAAVPGATDTPVTPRRLLPPNTGGGLNASGGNLSWALLAVMVGAAALAVGLASFARPRAPREQ